MKQKIAMCVVQYRNSQVLLMLLRIVFCRITFYSIICGEGASSHICNALIFYCTINFDVNFLTKR